MPQYRYRCEECRHEVELIQSMAEGDKFLAESSCANLIGKEKPGTMMIYEDSPCGGKFRRLIGVTQFKLEGRRWFSTGYD